MGLNIDQVRDQMAEMDLQRAIIDMAHFYGWLVHHDRGDVRSSTAGDPGFPDLVLARDGRIVFAELKRARGRVSPSQASWLDALALSDGGVVVEVWRPADWPRITDLLP